MIHLILDVESVGLYGDGFSVGWVVVDDVGGQTLEEGILAAPQWQAFSPSDDDRRWVLRNVPRQAITSETLVELRTQFWQAWEPWQRRGALMWADCGFPVEAAFLVACGDNFPSKRAREAPYPLHEIATLRLAVGLDPLGTEERLPRELPIHDPLCDARQSARLLLEALTINREMLARSLVAH